MSVFVFSRVNDGCFYNGPAMLYRHVGKNFMAYLFITATIATACTQRRAITDDMWLLYIKSNASSELKLMVANLDLPMLQTTTAWGDYTQSKRLSFLQGHV